MKIEFTTVDVFTDRKFGGNPLAVVTDARGLSTEQMQAIAAEFNLAETTFVLPPKDPAHTAHVRIFTPKAEMPFAGHPNVGTAFVLARAGQSYGRTVAGDRLVFEEKAGLVRMDLTRRTICCRHVPRRLCGSASAKTSASRCRSAPRPMTSSSASPRHASCGIPLVFAELRLADPRPPRTGCWRDLPRSVVGVHLYTHARRRRRDPEPCSRRFRRARNPYRQPTWS